MDTAKEEAAGPSTGPLRVQLQDAAEFMEEHASLVEQQKVLEVKRNSPQLKKKAKKVVDIQALAAEQRVLDKIGSVNWIGKLTEYRAAHPATTEGLKFLDETVGDPAIPRFVCTVTIFETSLLFGRDGISFSNKKASRQYASKQAVDWLIDNHRMPADGSVKFPKVVQQPADKHSSSGSITQSTSTSYAGQVPDLCHQLGFAIPTYRINPIAPNAAVYDAWADFGTDPRIEGKVGEVKNVYGKKTAKEEVARVVISFLRDIERQRLAEFEEDDRKRKRSPESTARDEIPGNTAKV